MIDEDWPQEDDAYNPGVSIFKGEKIDLSEEKNKTEVQYVEIIIKKNGKHSM